MSTWQGQVSSSSPLTSPIHSWWGSGGGDLSQIWWIRGRRKVARSTGASFFRICTRPSRSPVCNSPSAPKELCRIIFFQILSDRVSLRTWLFRRPACSKFHVEGGFEQQEKSLLQVRQSPKLLDTGGHLVDSEQALLLCQSDQFNLVTDSLYSCSQLLTFQVVAQQLLTGGANSAPLLFNQPIRLVTQYSQVFFFSLNTFCKLTRLNSSNSKLK